MTTKKTTPAEGLRTCIGSAKFGIEAHEAPIADFPIQPSQRDGVGRMCHHHWTEYTRALRKAASAGKADAPALAPKAKKPATATKPVAPRRTAREVKAAKPESIRTKEPRKSKVVEVPAEA